ncbi:MAG: ABC transporter substrate-binding protein, partial [Aliifodinibius sp.]|nr:amino acid ABC transporter substrate-binding protein [Fodinibius sp.]NIV14936.1 ABC transporter substrate-binding protein [Fodinibius sp.]NIY28795.1 ABC transporter substrate-binding protein [Fodinibius sp.]
IIAVDEINGSGGIDGRRVELLIKDNEFDPDICRIKAEELVAAGIEGLIGPMSSDMTLASVEIFNEAGISMISPTASTPKLSDIDDFFLRVNPSDESEGIK